MPPQLLQVAVNISRGRPPRSPPPSPPPPLRRFRSAWPCAPGGNRDTGSACFGSLFERRIPVRRTEDELPAAVDTVEHFIGVHEPGDSLNKCGYWLTCFGLDHRSENFFEDIERSDQKIDQIL